MTRMAVVHTDSYGLSEVSPLIQVLEDGHNNELPFWPDSGLWIDEFINLATCVGMASPSAMSGRHTAQWRGRP